MRYVLLAVLPFAACVAREPVATADIPLPRSQAAYVRSEIASAMKDPNSAQFRNERAFKTADGFTIICGQVNAKNSFGAYAGFSSYYVRMNGLTSVAVLTDNQANMACAEAASGTIMI